jgi:hypothetical protein
VSTLATAPRRAGSTPAGAAAWTRVDRLRSSTDVTLGVILAASLALVAFTTTGGVDLGKNTWVEIVLTAAGSAAAGTALLLSAPGRLWGLTTVLLFAALATLTFASISWSVQPADSWVEANRTLSYVAAFGAAVALARLFPHRWPALVGAIATAATVISAYALLVKVFPATFGPNDPLGRVHAPFDYWNACGLMAAMGLPACAWASARHGRGHTLRALTAPAVAVLVAVLVLSYSRGALLAAVVGLGCWFVLVPLRLRAAAMLALGAAGGATIAVWALSVHALTHDHASLTARTSAGHAFGLLLVLVLSFVTIGGFVAAFASDRVALPVQVRRRMGVVLVTLVALVPVGAVGAVALSSRGLPGEVSHVWHTLTTLNSKVSDNPGRLAELSNSRPRYWDEGLKVGEHALLKGAGALGYATAARRYSTDSVHRVQHAHSYVIETFADFGLIGIALSAALLAAWALATGRSLGFSTPLRPEHATELAGLHTLLAVVLVFGVHSLIDWTWFIPGTAVPGLVCAGWLAGRGPLAEPVGRARRRTPLSSSPAAAGALLALAAVTVLAAWAIWQPLRSADADNAATAALTRGNAQAALADARTAANTDPVSVEPLFELSAIYGALGERDRARHELVAATSLQPANPATWQAVGEFDVQHHQPGAALAELHKAQRLDSSSVQTPLLIAQAEAQLRGFARR